MVCTGDANSVCFYNTYPVWLCFSGIYFFMVVTYVHFFINSKIGTWWTGSFNIYGLTFNSEHLYCLVCKVFCCSSLLLQHKVLYFNIMNCCSWFLSMIMLFILWYAEVIIIHVYYLTIYTKTLQSVSHLVNKAVLCTWFMMAECGTIQIYHLTCRQSTRWHNCVHCSSPYE